MAVNVASQCLAYLGPVLRGEGLPDRDMVWALNCWCVTHFKQMATQFVLMHVNYYSSGASLAEQMQLGFVHIYIIIYIYIYILAR